MNRTIEKDIYKYVSNVITILKENRNFIFDITYNSNNNKINFFSEIEIEMWKESNLIYVNSIVIFINGKQQGTKEELLKDFLYDFFEEVKI